MAGRRRPSGGATLVRNESLRRGLAVLRVLAREGQPITAAELARRTRIPGPTVARLLATLADEALAVRDESGGWRPGPGVAELAGSEAGVGALVAAAGDVLRTLADETGETCLLTRVRLPDQAEVLVQEDADNLLGVTSWLGRVFDPRESVAGWVAAVSLPPEEVTAMAGDDPVAANAWEQHVAETRTRGYALDVDGLEAGLTLVGVPVPATVSGIAIGVAGPSSRLTPRRVTRIVPRLEDAARRLAILTE
jgi:DNA-binding IclR family transcriptional regulator